MAEAGVVVNAQAAPPGGPVSTAVDARFPSFRKNCLQLLRNSMADWVFARITSVPAPKAEDKEGEDADGNTVYNHYYGFAEEIWPTVRSTTGTPRNIWFKLATHTKEGILVGPVKFGIEHYATLPTPGEIVAGKVINNVHRNGFRYEWWCRDAQPLMHLARIAQYGTNATADALCLQSRLLSNIHLDNLWAFIRLIAKEDLQPFVDMYRDESRRELHPIRKEHGPRGYILDRSPHRFVLDVAKVCDSPTIYIQFLQRVREAARHEALSGVPPDEALAALEQELMELEEANNEEPFV